MDAEPSTTPRPPGAGLQLAAVFAGSVAGFTAGLLAARLGAIPSILIVSASCLVLFFTARVVADYDVSRGRSLLVTGMWAFTFTLSLATLGEATRPRRITRDLGGALSFFVRLMAIMAAALAAPTAAVLAGFRRAAPAEHHPPAPVPAPRAARAQALIGLAQIALMLFAFVLAMTIRDPEWRAAALVALVLVVPPVMLPIGSLAFRRVLARRSIVPPPALLDAVAEVETRTGVSFDRVLCVDPEAAGERIGLVILLPRSATLAISADLLERLTRPQLNAVLAHEAAHVRYRHATWKAAWGIVAAVASLIAAVALVYLVSPLFTRQFRLVGNFVAIFPLLVGRHLYDALVTRRHEAAADRFAVRLYGADALLGALAVIHGSDAPPDLVHDRWTTHGTWAVRSRRIREFDVECLRTSAAETRTAG